MVAGALARLGTVTMISPLELVRTKLQAQHVSYRELGACVRTSAAQGGWRSLWLGWAPTALRDVPFSALYWFNYELVKSWLCGRRPKDRTSVGISFVAGGISGTVAAILTLPFDVVKTRRQVALGAVEAVRVSPVHADSTWLLRRRIRAESGTRGLFAGFLPRIFKAAPSCAIMISTYELGKSFFQRLNLEQPLSQVACRDQAPVRTPSLAAPDCTPSLAATPGTLRWPGTDPSPAPPSHLWGDPSGPGPCLAPSAPGSWMAALSSTAGHRLQGDLWGPHLHPPWPSATYSPASPSCRVPLSLRPIQASSASTVASTASPMPAMFRSAPWWSAHVIASS
ncbi:Solute carrier family 25 member 39 [Myotis davidii]|uniref:Mitochondrial glutathione transporter SLC25A40 n=1 Tax=Myotis davidii TaxID=225400 RepID=L5LWH4_MYODS|nr:Solute carrier family 25 member 39 [Myotis davidii]